MQREKKRSFGRRFTKSDKDCIEMAELENAIQKNERMVSKNIYKFGRTDGEMLFFSWAYNLLKKIRIRNKNKIAFFYILFFIIASFSFSEPQDYGLMTWKYQNWKENEEYLNIHIKKIVIPTFGTTPLIGKLVQLFSDKFLGEGHLNLNYRHVGQCYNIKKDNNGVDVVEEFGDQCANEYRGKLNNIKVTTKTEFKLDWKLIQKIAAYSEQDYHFQVKLCSNVLREMPSWEDFIGKGSLEITFYYFYDEKKVKTLTAKCNKIVIGKNTSYVVEMKDFNCGLIEKLMNQQELDSFTMRITWSISEMLSGSYGNNTICEKLTN